jgi:hypothetical protein
MTSVHAYCQRNGHNYAASVTEGNARYTPGGVLYTIGGRVTCNVCQDERGVYELDELARYHLVRRLARMHCGSEARGVAARPMCQSMTLFALEAYGIDIPSSFPRTGDLSDQPGAFGIRASGDYLLTVAKVGNGDVPGDVPGSWGIVADQLARIPEADPRLSTPPGEIIADGTPDL